MNRSTRTIALFAGLALAGASAACGNDVAPVADALAQDSTLALQVLGANQDTDLSTTLGDTTSTVDSAGVVATTVENAPAVPDPAVPAPAASEPERVATVPDRAADREAPPRRARRQVQGNRTVSQRARRQRASREAQRSRTVRNASVASATSASTASGTTEPGRAPARESAPSRMWLIVPAGSQLELQADQRICTNASNVGDGFDATLAASVIRANGTVIPGGAAARGEVLSLAGVTGRNGKSEIGMRIESLTFNGRTYPVSSRVTYAEVKKVRTGSRGGKAGKIAAGAGVGAVLGQVLGRDAKATVIGAAGGAITGAVMAGRSGSYAQCVPDGGRITAELTEPLRVQMSE